MWIPYHLSHPYRGLVQTCEIICSLYWDYTSLYGDLYSAGVHGGYGEEGGGLDGGEAGGRGRARAGALALSGIDRDGLEG
eukprot:COSAG02_NODE_924_length_15868_cov_165.380430_4_plen_80_part_00